MKNSESRVTQLEFNYQNLQKKTLLKAFRILIGDLETSSISGNQGNLFFIKVLVCLNHDLLLTRGERHSKITQRNAQIFCPRILSTSKFWKKLVQAAFANCQIECICGGELAIDMRNIESSDFQLSDCTLNSEFH